MNLKTAANTLARLVQQGCIGAIDKWFYEKDNMAMPALIRQAIKDVDEAEDQAAELMKAIHCSYETGMFGPIEDIYTTYNGGKPLGPHRHTDAATLREARTVGWNEAVDTACNKAMALQTGFRGLLKDKRAEFQTAVASKDINTYRDDIDALSHEISQGEALVATLGDVIRNIAAMKGNYPK